MGGAWAVESFYDWFRTLYDDTGYNFVYFYEAYERERFIRGFWLTIYLSIICVALSVVIGVVGAWLQVAGLSGALRPRPKRSRRGHPHWLLSATCRTS